MTDRIVQKLHLALRRDTAAQWAANNPVLLNGEPGIEFDPDSTTNSYTVNWKVGNGTDSWNDLPYVSGSAISLPAPDGTSIVDDSNVWKLAGFDAATAGSFPVKRVTGEGASAVSSIEWVSLPAHFGDIDTMYTDLNNKVTKTGDTITGDMVLDPATGNTLTIGMQDANENDTSFVQFNNTSGSESATVRSIGSASVSGGSYAGLSTTSPNSTVTIGGAGSVAVSCAGNVTVGTQGDVSINPAGSTSIAGATTTVSSRGQGATPATTTISAGGSAAKVDITASGSTAEINIGASGGTSTATVHAVNGTAALGSLAQTGPTANATVQSRSYSKVHAGNGKVELLADRDSTSPGSQAGDVNVYADSRVQISATGENGGTGTVYISASPSSSSTATGINLHTSVGNISLNAPSSGTPGYVVISAGTIPQNDSSNKVPTTSWVQNLLSVTGITKYDGDVYISPDPNKYVYIGQTTPPITDDSNKAASTGFVHDVVDALTPADIGAIPATEKGTANGVAELDANGLVPSSQLPSFVDDTVEGYYNSTDGKFYEESTYTTEIPGESGKIYISLDTNLCYRWGGTTFVEISPSLALGETSSTAYRGDRGKAAYDNRVEGITVGGTAVTRDANMVFAIPFASSTGGVVVTSTAVNTVAVNDTTGVMSLNTVSTDKLVDGVDTLIFDCGTSATA